MKSLSLFYVPQDRFDFAYKPTESSSSSVVRATAPSTPKRKIIIKKVGVLFLVVFESEIFFLILMFHTKAKSVIFCSQEAVILQKPQPKGKVCSLQSCTFLRCVSKSRSDLLKLRLYTRRHTYSPSSCPANTKHLADHQTFVSSHQIPRAVVIATESKLFSGFEKRPKSACLLIVG